MLNYSHFCVVGPGALGLFLAQALNQLGPTSLFVKANQIEALKKTALRVSGDVSLRESGNNIRIISTKDLGSLPADTLYFSCVKAYDLDNSLKELLTHLSPSAAVVLCQNGLGILLQAAEIVGRRTALARFLPSFGCLKDSPNSVKISGKLNATVSATDPNGELTKYLGELFQKIGIQCSFPKNVALAEWEKVFFNLAINPLATILNDKNSVVIDSPQMALLTSKVLAEVRAVAKAEGFSLDHLGDEETFNAIRNCGENLNSTLMDMRAGKNTELEFFLGRFLRIAKSYCVLTPHLLQMSQSLKEIKQIQ